MVKNKKGGSGHKKMARKNVAPKGGYNKKLRKPREEGEIIARVTQMCGGGIARKPQTPNPKPLNLSS